MVSARNFCCHCRRLPLRHRQGCLLFAGWLLCRHLRLLSSQLCLRRNLCLWHFSSRLRLFADWLLRHLLSRRLHLASTFVAQPPLASILYCPSLFAPVVVMSNLATPPAHILPLAAPLLCICQLALSCTAIFVAPSLNAAAIAGILKCTAHPPDGGITNVHCPLLLGSCSLTRPPAPPYLPLCFGQQGEGTMK